MRLNFFALLCFDDMVYFIDHENKALPPMSSEVYMQCVLVRNCTFVFLHISLLKNI